MKQQPFYEPIDVAKIDFGAWKTILSYEDTVLFLVANFQIVICCIAFSKSKPFRKPIYTNPLFFASIILVLIFDTYMLFAASNSHFESWLDLKPFIASDGTEDYTYRYWIGLAVIVNGILTLLVENFIVNVVAPRHDKKIRAQQKELLQQQMEVY